QRLRAPRHPPSFPTRRSSDLIDRRCAGDSISLMNQDFPPLPFSQPVIRTRRREKPPFPQLPRITIEQRVERSQFLRTQTEAVTRSEEHTSELQSRFDLVCRLL